MTQNEEPEELKRFREAWKAEVNHNKASGHHNASASVDETAALHTHASTSLITDSNTAQGIADSWPPVGSKAYVFPAGIVTGALAEIIHSFPDDVEFLPDEELDGTPLLNIPDELIVRVLRFLDPTSIERFATVSRKARVISLDSSLWRELVCTTYKPPQIPEEDVIHSIIDHYLCDYRRVWIEHPRVRTDGVYIAVCQYFRFGHGENPWNATSHLVTYRRYLRFFPDGQVLSLLANEEHAPSSIIPLLKDNLRMKGLLIGTWHLEDTMIHLSNLIDPNLLTKAGILSDEYMPPAKIVDRIRSLSENQTQYMFQMSLILRSRPVTGRWNKLDILSYETVNLDTGDASPLVMKHERPFWFSKVRSYALG